MRYIFAVLGFLLFSVSVGCASAGHDRHQQIQANTSPSNAFHATRARESAKSLFFLDSAKGWIIANGVLYGTANGGKNWRIINQRSLQDCKSVAFTSDKTGWALCDLWNKPQRCNKVLTTRDGGKTWREILAVPSPIYSVDFVNDNVGFVSSRWWPLQRTTDGGNTWMSVNGVEGLHYLSFADKKKGWGFGSAIWYTEDAGQNWKQLTAYEATTDLWEADFPDVSSGWILGKGQVWHMSDSASWSLVKGLAGEVNFLSVYFLNPSEGWITADDGSLLKTIDAGSSWEVLSKLPIPITVHFLNKDTGWGLATDGSLFYSGDGGRNWQKTELN
jgi:photosystem II stability/assembly factor-like uncharacterized protein